MRLREGCLHQEGVLAAKSRLARENAEFFHESGIPGCRNAKDEVNDRLSPNLAIEHKLRELPAQLLVKAFQVILVPTSDLGLIRSRVLSFTKVRLEPLANHSLLTVVALEAPAGWFAPWLCVLQTCWRLVLKSERAPVFKGLNYGVASRSIEV